MIIVEGDLLKQVKFNLTWYGKIINRLKNMFRAPFILKGAPA